MRPLSYEERDFLLLDKESSLAEKLNRKEFRVNTHLFDGVPNHEKHIQDWSSQHGFKITENGSDFIFK